MDAKSVWCDVSVHVPLLHSMQSDGEVERFRWKYHGRAGVMVFVFSQYAPQQTDSLLHVPASSGYAQYIGYTYHPLSQCLQGTFCYSALCSSWIQINGAHAASC
jgi:hypothetical protein